MTKPSGKSEETMPKTLKEPMVNAIWAMQSGLPNLGVANLGYGPFNPCNLSYALCATWAMQSVLTRCTTWAMQSGLSNLCYAISACCLGYAMYFFEKSQLHKLAYTILQGTSKGPQQPSKIDLVEPEIL
eukprot:12410130-Karenia_brevis.AAC.1